MIFFTPPLLLAFIAAATVLTLTPGVDTAMVLRACASGGKSPARYAAAGICLGCLLWGAVVALGLGAILKVSHLAYDVVKYAGAAYLFWVGVNLIRHPRQGLPVEAKSQGQGARIRAFRLGLATNLLNPKIGIFYVTFLPQFIPPQANVAADSFILALIHVALTTIWFTVLIAAAMPLSRMLQRLRTISLLDRLAGGVFILFGLRLAFSRA